MSMVTKAVGLDPAIAKFKKRDYKGGLWELRGFVRKFAGNEIGAGYVLFLATVGIGEPEEDDK